MIYLKNTMKSTFIDTKRQSECTRIWDKKQQITKQQKIMCTAGLSKSVLPGHTSRLHFHLHPASRHTHSLVGLVTVLSAIECEQECNLGATW